jgi:hypothetical protein
MARPWLTIRNSLPGVVVAVLLFAMGGTTVVSADGGQPGLVHACILPIVDGGNVRIVGANETCPDGSTPLHWPGESQEVLQAPEEPPPPEPGPGSATPTKKVSRNLYLGLGIKIKQTKTVTKSLGPEVSVWKDLTVSCPGTHPFAVEGHVDVNVHDPEGDSDPPLFSGKSERVGWHAWRGVRNAYKTIYGFIDANGNKWFPAKAPVNWTLIVSVECAKLLKDKGTAKAKL